MKFGRFKPWNELKNNIDGTEHYEFHFKNGYGASVIRGPYSYGGEQGLYELAVLKLIPRTGDNHVDAAICTTMEAEGYKVARNQNKILISWY